MTAATTDRAAVLPSVVSVSRSRARVELKEFFRQREAVVFTVLLPVLLLVVFGAVLNYDIGSGVTFVQYFMAGIIAAGILGASLQNMAIGIATERSDGTLKALAGTPMPKSAYFVGKVVQVLAVTALIIGVLLLIGVVVYDIDLPSGGEWFTFAWVALLGAAACTLLGIAVEPGEERALGLGHGDAGSRSSCSSSPASSSCSARCPRGCRPSPRSSRSSGWPGPALSPPDALAAGEPAGSWELGRVALVLGAWCVAGLLLCVATFRWQDRGAG